jgi:TolB-like protein/Tfp pilus assembly protein PilF
METPTVKPRPGQDSSGFRRFFYTLSDRQNYISDIFDAPKHDTESGSSSRTAASQVNGPELAAAPLKRRLAAVLLADVVGYSRLMNLDEENTHVALTDYAKDVIEPKVTAQGGRLTRIKGDGFLAEFESAISAVRCGLDIQEALANHNAALPTDRRIHLRIGINTGDVIVDEHDIYGNSVNIAARLEGLADPGEIYVTRGVRDQLEGQPSLSFEDRGERRVKNFKTPIRVYRVKYVRGQPPRFLRPLIALRKSFSPHSFRFRSRPTVLSMAIVAVAATVGAVGMPSWREQWRATHRTSIMVLPFSNLSADSEQEYLADAITDDLTTDLSRLPGAFVISRGTAFSYKGKAFDAKQVGQECGVRYLLEGSIKRTDARLQTNAWLIDTASAGQLWADHFDNEVADLFQLEQDVTGRIASSLGIELIKAEGLRSFNEQAVNPDAMDLRARAMQLYFSSVTPEHTQEARRLLKEAVARDPYSAEAWGWLAEILSYEYLRGWNEVGKTGLREADEAVRTAVAIDPNLAQARYAEGLVRRAKGELQAALTAFTRAVELDPNFARAYAEKGNELTRAGRPGEAIPLAEKAIKLSPRDPALGGFYWIIGRAYFYMGRYPDAIPWLQKSVSARPNMWYNRLHLVSAYALSNHTDEARSALNEFNTRREFAGFTIERVKGSLEAVPDNNPVVVAARQKLQEGLQMVGMPER